MKPIKFQYVIDCVNATCEFVTYVVDNERYRHHPNRSRDVSLATFRKHCDLSPFRGTINFARDWNVGYHRSVTPSGIPVFYFDWSHIEYFFLPPGSRFDLNLETRVVRLYSAGRWWARDPEPGGDVHAADKDFQRGYRDEMLEMHGPPWSFRATRRVSDRLGSLRAGSVPAGDCFRFAAQFAQHRGFPDDLWVVHGTYKPHGSSKRVDHAWVEWRGQAYDWQTQDYPEGIPVSTYWRVADTKERVRYPGALAVAMAVRTGHWGPWDK